MGIDPESVLSQMPPGVNKDFLGSASLQVVQTLAELGRHMNNKDGKKKADFTRATQPQTVPSSLDNRQTSLHPARFLPQSLAPPSQWWHLTPTKRDIIVSSIQLRHLGVEYQVSPRTIELCHDRKNILTIKMFCNVNSDVAERPAVTKQVLGQGNNNPGFATVTDFNWLPVTKVIQIVEGVLTYNAIMSQLFPFDYGPLNILKTLNFWQYFAYRQGQQVSTLKGVVNGLLARNAQLAGEGRPPMTITEINEWIPMQLRSIGGGPCSLPDSAPADLFSSYKTPPTKPGNTVAPGRGGTRPTATRTSMAVRFPPTFVGSLELCGQYNTARGCPRTTAGTAKSCTTTSGNTLHHKCSHKDTTTGRICGQDHPKHRHP